MPIASPTVINQVFCSAGTVTTDYVLPPTTSADPTVTSQPLGIPPIQQLPLTAGGLPANRAQFNGALRLYTDILRWVNAGGQFTFDAAIAAIGGYNQGMILYSFADNRQVISLVNNNTNNFVTTPSFIDNVNWAFYPQSIYVRNVPISGNTPESTVTIYRNGAYTIAQMLTSNGVANNNSGVNATYSNGGNGVFKPLVGLYSQLTSGGYAASTTIGPTGASNNYLGLISAIYNQIDANNNAQIQLYPDISNNPYGVWYLVASGSTNTGLELRRNFRPQLVGASIATLGTNANTVTILNDFNATFGATGLQRLPGGLIIQWFNVIVNTRTNNTITYPIAFPSTAIFGLGCINQGVGLNLAQGYGVSVSVISTTQCTVSLTTAAPAGVATTLSIFILGI